MSAAWRSLQPRLFLRDNMYAVIGALLFGMLSFTLSLSNAQVDHWHPQHAWAAQGMRLLIGFALLTLSTGIFIHYWRIVAEPLVFPVPRFRRDHRLLFTVLLLIFACVAYVDLLRRHAYPVGALDLVLLFVAGGVLGAVMVRLRNPEATGGARWLRFVFFLPFYLPIYIGSIYWDIGTLPLYYAIPLALLLLSMILLALVYTPRELTGKLQAQRGRALSLAAPDFGKLQSLLAWTPANWRFPPLFYGPRRHGILGTLLQQALTLGVFGLFFALILPLEGFPKNAPTPENLIIVRVLALSSLLAVPWRIWLRQSYEWQSILLTGFWGGTRKEMLGNWLQRFAKHLFLLILTSLMLPLIALIILHFSGQVILALLSLLAAALAINAYSSLGVIALGFYSGPVQRFLVFLGILVNLFVLGFLTYRTITAPPAPQALRVHWDWVLAALALLPVLFAHWGGKRQLQRADWLLPGLGRCDPKLPVVDSAKAQEKGEQAWTAAAGFAIMLAFFLGQIGFGALAAFARSFSIGVQLGAEYAKRHEKLPSAVLQTAVRHLPIDFRVWVGLFAYAATAALLLFFLYQYLSRAQWRDRIGWRPPTSARAYGVALLLGIALEGISALLLVTFPPPHHLNPHTLGVFDALHMQGWPYYLMIALTVALAPFTEEIIFRGAGLAGLRQRFSPWVAASIVSLLFVIVHAPSKIDNFHYPLALLIIAMLAAALVWLRLRYRSLWPSIFLHTLWNGVAISVSLLH
ncbi:CPBP family intramembrane glutamic endopeptidase [Candidatus Igneacidithiobacillus taiwanensis]|uniref:CPBP family intramembrane glutamic endopeptidase n=1 Tax=Candidatus Igneacidithiobacillus taiwanensis TaxID=1945924 RepID=UPI002897E60D|nr:CPBP family intramembrane glutamic endopeptidase [Candidatus Igneacidithiobacillus taiwanensis]